ncbi:TPA: hypothetical protein ACH3X2_003181 [Trebouxia sp. C0005]
MGGPLARLPLSVQPGEVLVQIVDREQELMSTAGLQSLGGGAGLGRGGLDRELRIVPKARSGGLHTAAQAAQAPQAGSHQAFTPSPGSPWPLPQTITSCSSHNFNQGYHQQRLITNSVCSHTHCRSQYESPDHRAVGESANTTTPSRRRVVWPDRQHVQLHNHHTAS